MLEVVVLTLFETMFTGVLEESIVKRAQEAGLVQFRFINFRDFATDRHRTVDDSPFGGGAGMVLKPDPIYAAMESLTPLPVEGLGGAGQPDVSRTGQPDVSEVGQPNVSRTGQPDVSGPAQGIDETQGPSDGTLSFDGDDEVRLVLSPQGTPFTQGMAEELAKKKRIVMLCGHYEGFDERIISGLKLKEVSMGDFVLTGGEIPAMAIIDAVVRLLPGALGNRVSHEDDSFSTGLLEYPQYTRPANFRHQIVPSTLLSGNHSEIQKWRRRHALYRTWSRRPDLLDSAVLTDEDRKYIAMFERGDFSGIDVLDR